MGCGIVRCILCCVVWCGVVLCSVVWCDVLLFTLCRFVSCRVVLDNDRDRGVTLRLEGGGGGHISDSILGGGRHFFILALYNFKKYWVGTCPPPLPTSRSLYDFFDLKRNLSLPVLGKYPPAQ